MDMVGKAAKALVGIYQMLLLFCICPSKLKSHLTTIDEKSGKSFEIGRF